MGNLELDAANLKIYRLVVGALETNCYLLLSAGSAALVDPGGEADRISALLDHHPPLVAMLLTHVHADHFAAVGDLKRRFPAARVHHHKSEADWLSHPAMSLSYWLQNINPCPPAEVLLEGGERLALGAAEFEVLHLPGHTPGSVGYFSRSERVLLSGDVLFTGSIGRTDLPASDAAAMAASLERLQALPDEVLVLPGHGPATTIGYERQWNPYFSEQG